jgi:hypothetical protein
VSNQRILQEYKYLAKSKECQGLSVDFEDGDNMYKWLAKLDVFKFDIGKSLREQFTRLRDQYN